MKMDDSGLQAAGAMLKTTQYTPKVMKTTVKAVLKTGKVAVKTAKTTVRGAKGAARGIKFIHKNGFKAAGKAAGNAAMRGTQKLAQKSAQLVLQSSKGLIIHVVVPAVAIIICAAVMVSMAFAPIMAVGSMLDNFLAIFRQNDSGETIEESIDVDVDFFKNPLTFV